MSDQEPIEQPMPRQEPKRAYARPSLVIYGSLKDITRAVGHGGNLDGGVMAMNRSLP